MCWAISTKLKLKVFCSFQREEGEKRRRSKKIFCIFTLLLKFFGVIYCCVF